MVVTVKADAVEVGVVSSVTEGAVEGWVLITGSAVEVVTVKADAVDVCAIDGVVVEDVVVIADAVEVVEVVFDVGVASIDVDWGIKVDATVAGVSVVDATATEAVGVFASGATTAVAIVVVDVVTVTCCETISDDPMEARFAASRAAAGDISPLVVAVAVVALAVVVDLIRANPSPRVSGPAPFEPFEAAVVFPFAFTCICFNAALSVWCCFVPF